MESRTEGIFPRSSTAREHLLRLPEGGQSPYKVTKTFFSDSEEGIKSPGVIARGCLDLAGFKKLQGFLPDGGPVLRQSPEFGVFLKRNVGGRRHPGKEKPQDFVVGKGSRMTGELATSETLELSPVMGHKC